jgi:hypothetical protein
MSMSPKLLRPRQTGFNPKGIAGLFAWWDPSASSGVTSSGGFVSSLHDRSGNGRNAVQATGSAQPALTAINGRVALLNESGDGLIATTSYSITAQSTFAVFAANAYAGFGRIVTQESDTENAVYIPLLLPNDSTFKSGAYFAGAYRSGLTITQSSPVIGESHHNGSSVTNVVNGVSGATHAGSLSFSPTKIGVGNSPALFSTFIGRIGEVLIWNRALTAAEIVSVRRYLSSKWGIAVS